MQGPEDLRHRRDEARPVGRRRVLKMSVVGLGIASLLTVGGCELVIRQFGGFPGSSCSSSASLGLIRKNWSSAQRYKLQYEDIALPDLVDLREPKEIPGTENDRDIQCEAIATFADGSENRVTYSWGRNFRPNLVSGPRFNYCVEGKTCNYIEVDLDAPVEP